MWAKRVVGWRVKGAAFGLSSAFSAVKAKRPLGGGDAGDGGEDSLEVAEVDEDVGGEDEVEFVGCGEGLEEVGLVDFGVDAAGFGLGDHVGGEVDADEAVGDVLEGLAAEAGAAAEVEDVEFFVRGDGDVSGDYVDGLAEICWTLIMEVVDEVVVEAGGGVVEEASDGFGGHGGEGFAAEGGAFEEEFFGVGIGGEALIEGGEGFRFFAGEVEEGGEGGVGGDELGVEIDGGLAGFGGEVEVAELEEGGAEAVVGFGELGVVEDGLSEAVGGVFEAAFLEEEDSGGGVVLGSGGLEFDEAGVEGEGLVGLALGFEEGGEVDDAYGKGWI